MVTMRLDDPDRDAPAIIAALVCAGIAIREARDEEPTLEELYLKLLEEEHRCLTRRRVIALIGKELREFRANPSAILPVVLVVLVCLILPFLVLVAVPSATGQSLANDDTLPEGGRCSRRSTWRSSRRSLHRRRRKRSCSSSSSCSSDRSARSAGSRSPPTASSARSRDERSSRC